MTAEATVKKDERLVIHLPGGVQIDVTDLPALTLRDKRALKAEGVDLGELFRNRDPEVEAKFIRFILGKFRPETTEDEVYEIPLVTVQRFMMHAVDVSGRVDRPFLNSSTSSPPNTGGDETKSNGTLNPS